MSIFLQGIALIWIVILCSPVIEAKQAGKTKMKFYKVDVRSKGVKLVGYINGVEFIETSEEVMKSTVLNRWLKKEDNGILLEAEALDKNSKNSISISLDVYEVASDGVKKEKEITKLSYEKKEGEERNFPIKLSSKSFEFKELSAAFKMWKDSQSISSLSEDDKKQIFQLVGTLSQFVSEGEGDKAFNMMEHKFTEESIAEALKFDDLKKNIIASYNSMKSMKDKLKLNPVKLDNLEFHIEGNGKIVRVVEKGQETSINFMSDGEVAMGIPTYFSKIDSKWILVR